MKHEYSFDFGPKPSFIYDAWFIKAMGPVLLLSLIFFPLCAISDFWITRVVFPSIAAGAITIFIGIYLYRRVISKRRIKGLSNTVFNYTIDDEGIHYDNELGSGVLRWGFKGKLIPLKNFILLQSSEVGLLPLPADLPEKFLSEIRERLK
jgi:hypothetical protein